MNIFKTFKGDLGHRCGHRSSILGNLTTQVGNESLFCLTTIKAKNVKWLYTSVTISQPSIDFPSFLPWAKLLHHDFSYSLANLFNSLSHLAFLCACFTNPCPFSVPGSATCFYLKPTEYYSPIPPAAPTELHLQSAPGESSFSYPFIYLWSAAYPNFSASSKVSL